ncbi:MAG TPA: iron uptake porin, partial [Oscillatoriales cyanobacterium M59_W2019_021]|nr:iron uptake porin [Oscillatoriales cyanobacterium M59_W2019_021]
EIRADRLLTVDELSDVQPSDWAYQALKSIIERYDLDLGYPDGTYRGDRSMTRYEFAAAVAAALDALLERLDRSDTVLQEDLNTLAQLQINYQEAIDELNARLDNRIQPRIDRLEERQFSATTQLQGQFVLGLTDGNNSSKTTFVDRLRLNLTTQFSPQTRLVTQLEAGNNGQDAIAAVHNRGDNLLGTTGLLAGAGGLDYVEVGNQLRLRRLYYSFQPTDRITVAVGPKLAPGDFIDRNRFADDSDVNFNSSFFFNNPLIVQNQVDRPGGAGVAVAWDLQPFTLTGVYAAADAADPQMGGFWRDPYQASLELEYAPDPAWTVRLQYTHAEINGTDIDAVGVNGEWAVNPYLGLFARLGRGDYHGYNTVLSRDLDLSPVTWAVGMNVRNWPVPGNVAGVAIGQPFVSNDLGNASQTNFEAFYHLQLSDNLSLTPALIVVGNADNDSRSETTWQGVLRMVFSF